MCSDQRPMYGHKPPEYQKMDHLEGTWDPTSDRGGSRPGFCGLPHPPHAGRRKKTRPCTKSYWRPDERAAGNISWHERSTVKAPYKESRSVWSLESVLSTKYQIQRRLPRLSCAGSQFSRPKLDPMRLNLGLRLEDLDTWAPFFPQLHCSPDGE